MDRPINSMWQRVCVASLIGHCEAILASDLLGPDSAESLRVLLAETTSAFGMQHHDERNAA